MERRSKSASPKQRRSINPLPEQNSVVDPVSLPRIADFIDYGSINIGILEPVGCVAVAADDHNCLAMLRRREGETLAQLLTRLDQAIAKALDEDTFTDEINSSR